MTFVLLPSVLSMAEAPIFEGLRLAPVSTVYIQSQSKLLMPWCISLFLFRWSYLVIHKTTTANHILYSPSFKNFSFENLNLARFPGASSFHDPARSSTIFLFDV